MRTCHLDPPLLFLAVLTYITQRSILSNVITEISKEEVDQIFTRVDSNDDGFIDYGTLVPPLLPPLAPQLSLESSDEFTTFLRENPEYMQLISFRLAERQAEEKALQENEKAADSPATNPSVEGQQADA